MAKVSKHASKTNRTSQTDRPGQTERSFKSVTELGSSFGGFLGKLGDLVSKLGELAETGQELSRCGEFEDRSGKVRGVYGFSVKTGLGEHGRTEFQVEPFGNLRCRRTGEPVVDELREPLVDVHEEEDHVLVLAEIPGVSKKDVEVELDGARLTLSAQHRQTRYRKEVILPQKFPPEKMHWDCKNGILSIRLER